ncbi:coproporphyrinogen III oxidase [Fusobacterium sp. PH5-44]|uniref:coproporphyrinogen III oxidase n=1 Tax=unclassified Fusobacterium TaxID=2648384 RepID=UPI003D24C92A
MYIKSDFNINIKSIEEFARVAVPEALDKELKIEHQENSEIIQIKLSIENKSKEFKYKNLYGKIDDQKSTMVKILLLLLYEKDYSWGGLIGVRPSKIARRLLNYGCNISDINNILEGFYLVKKEKSKLLIDVVLREEKLLNKNFINIYIGIPFCPTKCTYCSFASYEINSGVGRYYDDFISTLLEEVKLVGEYLSQKNYKIESIYIGGGTPSVLKESDLKLFLKQVKEYIDFTYIKEFTFEAGREDTLNHEKLQIMKEYGINRVSLNPQTFNEKTLKLINRKLNKGNFDDLYDYCKSLDFVINMDLIIGLPEESTEDILKTLKEITKYNIENLTIHSLAYKRHSNLFKSNKMRNILDQNKISDKINEIILQMGLKPYYLYRQKNILEWGENIGYSKDGYESLFNIEMIEENQMTMGLGGGAISKFISSDKNNRDFIERIVNPKDPALYIMEMEKRTLEKFVKLEKIREK